MTDAIGKLEKDYGRRLRVVFRHYPLPMHSHAIEAALAAEAAGSQGRFWEMHDLLYKNQAAWSKASDPAGAGQFFTAYARSLGLDVERFAKDSNSDEVKARIFWEGQLGVSRGVTKTPTLLINGREMGPPFTQEHLRAEIDTALGGSKNF
jgi:protein-disulfide isomerase